MTSEIERVISLYQDKINKLEEMLELKQQYIDQQTNMIFLLKRCVSPLENLFEENELNLNILQKKIEELEKELE